jgi:hypothetical protein
VKSSTNGFFLTICCAAAVILVRNHSRLTALGLGLLGVLCFCQAVREFRSGR